jgi:hypothetical protein
MLCAKQTVAVQRPAARTVAAVRPSLRRAVTVKAAAQPVNKAALAAGAEPCLSAWCAQLNGSACLR